MEKDESSLEKLSVKGTGLSVAEIYQKKTLKVWLAVMVRMFHEQRIGELLTKNGIENFVPLQKEYHKWSDRMKLINHVVIPRVVFVRVAPIERRQVLELPSAVKYVVACGEHQPAIIPDNQINSFKFMLGASDNAVNIIDRPMRKGEKVKIIRGPLANLEGELITINSEKEVGVYLNAFGYACVNVPIENIQVLSD